MPWRRRRKICQRMLASRWRALTDALAEIFVSVETGIDDGHCLALAPVAARPDAVQAGQTDGGAGWMLLIDAAGFRREGFLLPRRASDA